MALGAAESGKIVAQSADELLRIWRLARASARRDVFPGLLDGALRDFLSRAGRLLASGGEPEAAWGGAVGTVRTTPGRDAKELTEEWAILMEVLTAACESFEAEPAVGEWLARAIAAGEKGTAAIATGGAEAKPPPGILVLHAVGETRPPRRIGRG